MSTRLRSRLVWRAVPPAPDAAAARAAGAGERPDFDTPTAPRERAIRFLSLGSEIEHALMVQYLYAAYSLDEQQPTEERRALVRQWRAAILEVAREEMGHLATVQNLLTLIGGPLCFERGEFPIEDEALWPFPFQLEALTRDSLAKYVLAEMPSDEVLAKLKLTDEIAAIKRRLQAHGGVNVHRVGALYQEIMTLFTAGPMLQGPIVPGVSDPHPFVATADIQADTLPLQASAGAWGLGYKDILIETATDRPSALDAITRISAQGEGPITADDQHLAEEFAHSHFRRFLDIYRAFPESSDWVPARPVATNPTTAPGVADPARRIDGAAAPWAALANLRYRMLLLSLQHSFYVDAEGGQAQSARGALVSWAFGEMYNLRTLAGILMALPLSEGSRLNAGPPFEMPYTLSLPARRVDRWRAHRDLLIASLALIDGMRAPGHETYLRGLRAADQTALDQVAALIGA